MHRTNKALFKNHIAEEMRLRGLYRKLILDCIVKLPYASLKGLVGPDCAYHLYRFDSAGKSDILNIKTKMKGRKNAKDNCL